MNGETRDPISFLFGALPEGEWFQLGGLIRRDGETFTFDNLTAARKEQS